jgi:CheY-like chemotaxis protein
VNKDKPQTNSLIVLMAEDDPDDRFLIERAFSASGLSGKLLFVEDGEELLDYLFRRARYADTALSPRPSCILLDLKMPRKDGREALWEIKENPGLRELPIIVLTTSDSQHDKEYCVELGVSDYITKPGSFAELIRLMKRIEVGCVA